MRNIPSRGTVLRPHPTFMLGFLFSLSLTAGPGCLERAESLKSAEAVSLARAAEAFKSTSGNVTAPLPASPEKEQAARDVAPAVPRKIIYNARLTLVVDDVGKTDSEINRLVKAAAGYISGSDVSSLSHFQRTATWTVRVPVENYALFLDSVGRLGEVQQNHVDSQDVTQEYYDVEARISNKQQEERRLQKHLADSTGRLEDILAVERELTRVRGEVEQAQGRLRYLSNLSALSTVTISASEVRDYLPPVRPTFAGRVRQTFDRSIENLLEFVQAVVLGVVAFSPWIPVVLVVAVPAFWLLRKVLRRLHWTVRLEPVNPTPPGRGVT